MALVEAQDPLVVKLQRIMVAIKPWEQGLPIVAEHARKLAQGPAAEIEIVGSVFDAAVSAGRDRGDVVAQRAQTRTVAAARAALERLASSMREAGARVGTKIVWGVPAYEVILGAATDWAADLVVLGTHERGALHTRLTDTDWQLLRRTRCPLLLVKGSAFSGYRTILAAVDARDAQSQPYRLDDAVLAASRCIARACNSTVRAVYTYPEAATFERASAARGRRYGSDPGERLQRRPAEKVAEALGIASRDVDVVAASPAQAIIDAAAHRRAELVVVGAAQGCPIASGFIGNTAELVAGELPCDVLVVPLPAKRPNAAEAHSKVG